MLPSTAGLEGQVSGPWTAEGSDSWGQGLVKGVSIRASSSLLRIDSSPWLGIYGNFGIALVACWAIEKVDTSHLCLPTLVFACPSGIVRAGLEIATDVSRVPCHPGRGCVGQMCRRAGPGICPNRDLWLVMGLYPSMDARAPDHACCPGQSLCPVPNLDAVGVTWVDQSDLVGRGRVVVEGLVVAKCSAEEATLFVSVSASVPSVAEGCRGLVIDLSYSGRLWEYDRDLASVA